MRSDERLEGQGGLRTKNLDSGLTQQATSSPSTLPAIQINIVMWTNGETQTEIDSTFAFYYYYNMNRGDYALSVLDELNFIHFIRENEIMLKHMTEKIKNKNIKMDVRHYRRRCRLSCVLDSKFQVRISRRSPLRLLFFRWTGTRRVWEGKTPTCPTEYWPPQTIEQIRIQITFMSSLRWGMHSVSQKCTD